MPVTLSAIQGAIGIGQSIFGGIQAHKAQKQLERTPTPVYSPSQSILDYYDTAKSRYNVNPYQSSLYKLQNQNIQRGTAQGLGALNDRRSALAGVNSLIQGQNDSLLKAGAAAEDEQSRRFSQLGNAAGMKAQEDMKQFQYNQVAPYEKRMQLAGLKASGGNQLLNAGLSNVFGGLQSAAEISQINKLYGTQKGTNTAPTNVNYESATYPGQQLGKPWLR
jgi:hypothetical protein